MFLCIPLICGPQSSLKSESQESYYCPRFRNPSAKGYKRKRWFELYWIPLVPLGSKQIYLCPVCRWEQVADESTRIQRVDDGGSASKGPGAVVGTGRGYDVGYQTETYPPPPTTTTQTARAKP